MTPNFLMINVRTLALVTLNPRGKRKDTYCDACGPCLGAGITVVTCCRLLIYRNAGLPVKVVVFLCDDGRVDSNARCCSSLVWQPTQSGIR